jgi:MFS transporter, DHA2 family, multidrug resistance protein
MLFITEYLQLVKGLTALGAAFWMLPVVSASVVTVLVAPMLARRIRPAYLISGGLLVSAAGLLIIVSARAESSPLLIVIGWAVMNIGAGPYVALVTNIVVGATPPERAGSAAALNETAGEFGYALGIAALGSAGTAVYRSGIATHLASAGLPAAPERSARDSLAGAVSVAHSLPTAAGNDLLTVARSAFVDGMHVAATISAVVLVALAALVAVVLRRVPPNGAPAKASEPAGPESSATDPARPTPARSIA